MDFRFHDSSAKGGAISDIMAGVSVAVHTLYGIRGTWEEVVPHEEYVYKVSVLFIHVIREDEYGFEVYVDGYDSAEDFIAISQATEAVFEDVAYVYRCVWKSIKVDDLTIPTLCREFSVIEEECMEIWNKIEPLLNKLERLSRY